MKRTKFLVGLTAAMLSVPGVALAATEALNTGLSTGYTALSEGEYDEFDYVDGDLFRAKARKADRGGNVQPENPDDWMIPEAYKADIDEAYAWLLMAYEKGGDIETPEYLAEAQVSYDCWVQEAEEDLQPEEIEKCKANYIAARDKVKFPEPKPEPRAPIVFDIFFDHDSTELNSAALDDIRAAASAAREEAPIDVRIAGHTDRSGSSAYNEKLARARAEIVAAAMIAEGIGEDLIVLSSFGEDQPRVETADGVRERLNRRAEVRLVFGGEAPAASMFDDMGSDEAAPVAPAAESEDDFFDSGQDDDLFAEEPMAEEAAPVVEDEPMMDEAPADEMSMDEEAPMMEEEEASEAMESEMDTMEDEMMAEEQPAAASDDMEAMEEDMESMESEMEAMEEEMEAAPAEDEAPAEDDFLMEEDTGSDDGLEFLGDEGGASDDGMDFLSGEADENPEEGLDFLNG